MCSSEQRIFLQQAVWYLGHEQRQKGTRKAVKKGDLDKFKETNLLWGQLLSRGSHGLMLSAALVSYGRGLSYTQGLTGG
jgi:hypothetical protein